MQLIQLVELEKTISPLLDKELPFDISYSLAELSEQVTKNKTYYQKEFTKLINKYAQKDENGNPISEEDSIRLLPETADECMSKVEELNNFEIDISNFPKLKKESLSSLSLTPRQVFMLKPFIED